MSDTPTVPDLHSAAQALRDLLGAMDRTPDQPVAYLMLGAAPELAVLRQWAAEATEPPPEIARGPLLDAVHMVTGVVELIVQVPEAEYADHLGLEVAVVLTEGAADG
jgi:hypothetical protein